MHHAAAGHYAGMLTSAAKAEVAVDAITAIGQIGALWRAEISGHNTVYRSEQLRGDRWFEECRQKAAGARNHRQPPNGALESRKFLNYAHLAHRVEFRTAVDMRHAHAEDPRLHQRVRESVRQVPLPINRFGGLPNVRF